MADMDKKHFAATFLLPALYFHDKTQQQTSEHLAFKAKHIIHCLLCDDKVWSRWEGEMKWCKCGKCAIDETSHYFRTVGEKGEFEIIDKQDKEDE